MYPALEHGETVTSPQQTLESPEILCGSSKFFFLSQNIVFFSVSKRLRAYILRGKNLYKKSCLQKKNVEPSGNFMLRIPEKWGSFEILKTCHLARSSMQLPRCLYRYIVQNPPYGCFLFLQLLFVVSSPTNLITSLLPLLGRVIHSDSWCTSMP